MNHTRPTLGNYLLAPVVAALFFAVIHLAERDTEHASRVAAINAELAATEARQQQAATQLCQAEAGPGAQVLWTQDGDLVCRPALLTAQAEGGAQ